MVGEEDASSLRDASNPLTSKVFESVRSVIPDVSDDEILSAIDYGTYEGGATGRTTEGSTPLVENTSPNGMDNLPASSMIPKLVDTLEEVSE